MCVVIPVKIIGIEGSKATVDVGGGETTEIDISLVEASVGDYIIQQTGFALRIVPEDEALESIELFRKMKEQGIYD